MDKSIYKKRRDSLKTVLPDNSVLLIPGADMQYRNADSAYPFRQESNFYYFSGFCEPESLLIIINDRNTISSIAFVPPKDKLKEIWDGYRSGPLGAVNDFLFDKAYNNTEINNILPNILKDFSKVLFPMGRKKDFK